MLIRFSPRIIVTIFTLHFCLKFNSFRLFPILGEFCFTSKSAKWRSRSNKWFAKRWLIGAFRSCSISLATRLLKKCRSIKIDCLFSRLENIINTITAEATASIIPSAAFNNRATGSMTRPIQSRILRITSDTRGPRLYLLSFHNCWNSTE